MHGGVAYHPDALLNLTMDISEDVYLTFLSLCLDPAYFTLDPAILRKYSPITLKFIIRKPVYLKVYEFEKNQTLREAKDAGYDDETIKFVKEHIRTFSP